jgi:hypothetical protein
MANMNSITKTSTLIFVFVLLLLFQSNHFFEIESIVPNLTLIAFLILSLKENEGSKIVLFIGIFLVAVSLLWFSFWVWGVILIFIFGIISNFISNFLSGNIFIDYFLVVVLATFLFYAVFYFIGSSFFIWSIVLGEVFYNLILGELFLFLFNDFLKK